MENYKEKENDFLEKISTYFSTKEIGAKYGIIKEPNLSEFSNNYTTIKRRPDFLILKGPYPYIVVEVKLTIDIRKVEFIYKEFELELEMIGADYFIVTDLVEIIVFSKIDTQSIKILPFDEIYTFFEEFFSELEIERYKAKIAEHIKRIAKKYSFRDTDQQSPQSFLQEADILNYLSYNEDGRYFHFSKNKEQGLNSFENVFFQTLLYTVSDEQVCRFTTLESLYSMINYQTYRMASPLAMNDRGEFDYVDKYINGGFKPLVDISLTEMQQFNQSYISSCTEKAKEDDLTMYRLYGDDSKGVCLCFDIKKKEGQKFIIKKISYAVGSGNHPELDLVSEIVNSIYNSYKLNFKFLYLDIWRHFFKSHEYSIEKEVRLLYLEESHTDTTGWVIAMPDKILSKYILFKLLDENSDFPLRLSKITLGPNCPEPQLNKKQMEVFLKEKKFSNVAVENSKIDSYRRS